MDTQNKPVGKIGVGVFDWSDAARKQSTRVIFNYTGNLKIHFNENVQKTFSKNGYYLAGPFPQEKGRVDLSVGGQQYAISKIYVLAKEVVIQHDPLTNGIPLTVRIPIISASPKNSRFTAIDRLLSNTPTVRFQLNNLLEDGGGAALYAGGTVLYLKTGISIQTGLPEKNAVNPYDEIGIPVFDADYTLVTIHMQGSRIEGFRAAAVVREGLENPTTEVVDATMDMTDLDDEMECTPYDIGADNVQFLQVPIADETLSKQSDKNTMYGVLYMFYMGIIVLAVSLFAPMFVSMFFSDLNNRAKNNDKFSYLALLFVAFFLGSIFLILDGSERKSMEQSRAGLVMFFIGFVFFGAVALLTVLRGILASSAFAEKDQWQPFMVLQFLSDCFPRKKFEVVSYLFLGAFGLFLLMVLLDKYVMKGKYTDLTPYLFMWGIFYSLVAGLLLGFTKLLEKFGSP